MRNILLVMKNNLYRFTKEKVMMTMVVGVMPIIICLGVYFNGMDSIKGKIAVVGARIEEKEMIEGSMMDNEKVKVEFLEESPSKTELIKGVYLAEINFQGNEPSVISYGKDDIKKSLEANLKGEVYVGDDNNATVQGKIIGFLIMFLFFGATTMVMDFFLVDRENHDPYGDKSFYKLINWPNNVYIFKGDLEKVYLEDLDINVWGYGFREKYIRESALKDFSEPSDKINIMVLHGEISSSNRGNEYNPITFDDIRNSGMDYIALGHRHNFSGINKEGQTFYAYSGCPQGRGFDELGDKGIIYGYVSKGTVDLEFVKTSKRNYIEEHIDISDCFGYEEVKKSIIDSIKESDRKHNLYKIVLEGEISPDFSIDEELLRERLGLDFYYCKIVDKTRVKYNIKEITKGYSVKSLFVKKIMNLIDSAETEEDKEVLMMALKVGLSSLSEGQVNMNDY